MPSAFTHIFVAGTLGKTCTDEKMPLRFWVLTAVCSLLPDIDIAGYYFGIKYGGLFGHRGFFHSLAFALLASILVVLIAFPALSRFSKKWWGLTAFFFAVTASHGFLDSMTDKGMGVGFFIPFDNTRYFMFWRPVFASPMRIERFFSLSGMETLSEVLVNEIIWIWTPMIALYAVAKLYRRKKSQQHATSFK
jgi:inner membrane protein